MKKTDWTVYIVECRDGTLYTGIAKTLEQRIELHNNSQGAKYTRGRGPVRLVYSNNNLTESKARKAEAKIKRLSRIKKLALIAEETELLA